MPGVLPGPIPQYIWDLVMALLSSLQISALITWGLQGVLCVQVYNYYLSFPRDPLYMKILVYSTLFIETSHTMMVTRDAYEVFAVGFGQLEHVDQLHLLWLTLPILGGLVGFLCHLIFAYRISRLSNSRLVGAVIVTLSLLATASAFTFGAQLYKAQVLSRAINVPYIYLVCGLWNGAGAVTDAAIAACMTVYLLRSQTGFRKTDVLITRIVRLTLETGLASATASIASAVLFVGFRSQLHILVFFMIPAIMITKLYAITILATFNNRPDAVGGPPPIVSESDHGFEEIPKTFSRSLSMSCDVGCLASLAGGSISGGRGGSGVGSPATSRKEIRIGTSVVRQVWSDVDSTTPRRPVEHLEMFCTRGGDIEFGCLKDDASLADTKSSTIQRIEDDLPTLPTHRSKSLP